MATPAYLEQSVKTGFAQAWRELQRISGPERGLMNAALMAPSNSKEEDYGWLGSVPGVTEFLQEARLEQLSDYDFTIRNRDWHAAVQIRKSDYKDDKTGSAAQIGRLLAERLGKKPADLIEDLLINGDSNTAYDGVAFFSDTSSPRVNDNLLAGTGTTVSALMTDLESAETAMAEFVDDKGEYLNLQPNIIVCGPSLYNKFLRIVGSQADPSASGGVDTYNPFFSKYMVYRSPKIGADDANDFYVLASNGVLKPFIVQTREQPKVETEDRPTLPTYAIVASSRGNVGYGLPHLAVKVVES